MRRFFQRRPGCYDPFRVSLMGVMLLAGLSCGTPDPTIHPADSDLLLSLATYRELGENHRVVLADSTEPGQRLFVLGRLVQRGDRRPLPGLRVAIFHTNANGSYEEAVAGDESTARLSGSVEADSAGRFLMSTILPGGYGRREGGHIHIHVSTANAGFYDIHFAQYAGWGLRRWAERTQRGVVFELHAMGDTLVVAGDLPIQLLSTIRE